MSREPITPIAIVEQEEPIVMVEMKVSDVANQRTTNITSSIQKP